MGCLKKIIKSLILCLAFIGFVSIGGNDFVKTIWNKYNSSQLDNIENKASKIGDFSNIGEEFEISNASSLLGYTGVIAEHKYSGQKMIILQSNKSSDILTEEDINNNIAEEKINKLTKKIKYTAVRIQDLKLGKKGTMTAYGKTVPYVRFNAKVTKVPFGDIEGIISAYDNNGENKLLISASEKNKYSQIITQEFFKKVKNK